LELYRFQDHGADWLAQTRRAYLADGMGLGKTVQFAVAAARAKVKKPVVICPASAIGNWQRDWEEWGPKVKLTTVSFASPKLDDMRGSDFDLAGIDEAHYCKTRNALRTRRAFRVARQSERKWLLSATPMPNHPGELWAPVRMFWPEIPAALGLDSHSEWFNYFCKWFEGPHGPVVTGTKNMSELRPYLKRIMLRRQLEDVGIQLPPLRVHVSLLARDAKFAGAERLLAAHDGEEHASRRRRYIGEYKAPLIGDLIAEELKQQQYSKIVVMYRHHSVRDILMQKLAKFGVVGFDGSTSQPARQFAIDVFRDGKPPVFLVQQDAGGVAINLQVSSETVLAEPGRSPEEDAQAIKRIHRIGTTRPCRARIFAVPDSYDDNIMRGQAVKIQNIIDAGLRKAS
jgi:SWI/SNF-related matrix-associated actin-dependent regulator of chromatin subfamily A-like protein 1